VHVLHWPFAVAHAGLPKNSIFLITPYWNSGTWVFDDPSVGLVKEPFVAGVPEILNELVSPIPNARTGFRLFFSESPFPGWQDEFLKVRDEYSGTWYQRAGNPKAEGWLCPALFKYFSQAPERLFVKAEPL
jgi:hypothetical protein